MGLKIIKTKKIKKTSKFGFSLFVTCMIIRHITIAQR